MIRLKSMNASSVSGGVLIELAMALIPVMTGVRCEGGFLEYILTQKQLER